MLKHGTLNGGTIHGAISGNPFSLPRSLSEILHWNHHSSTKQNRRRKNIAPSSVSAGCKHHSYSRASPFTHLNSINATACPKYCFSVGVNLFHMQSTYSTRLAQLYVLRIFLHPRLCSQTWYYNYNWHIIATALCSDADTSIR